MNKRLAFGVRRKAIGIAQSVKADGGCIGFEVGASITEYPISSIEHPVSSICYF
ncbi:MAG: hypothetical protein QNJ58_25060 [Desulfobacterales bacterium]|nr:hypothetical protein [Desulfobacterales bacterium]